MIKNTCHCNLYKLGYITYFWVIKKKNRFYKKIFGFKEKIFGLFKELAVGLKNFWLEKKYFGWEKEFMVGFETLG